MRWDVVVLTGQIASGKSTLARSISEIFGGFHLKSSDLLREYLSKHSSSYSDDIDRSDLQKTGVELDKDTQFGWLSDVVPEPSDGSVVVVDSVRVKGQIDALRHRFGPGRVFHIHLTANDSILRERFVERSEGVAYDSVKQHSVEQGVEAFASDADLVCDTGRLSSDDVVYLVAGMMGFRANHNVPLVDVIVGAQYGSEGKGHVVSYIAPEYDYLVRVGGANAGHTVVYDGGKKFAFKLIPSGTLHAPKAKIVLGPGANLDLDILLHEIEHCNLDPSRLFIDPQANMVIDQDVEDEASIVRSIGSTGQGVGRATARRILNRNVGTMLMARDVPELAPYIKATLDVMDTAFRTGKRVLLEGTQGTGLSLYHGPYPHVTSRDTTVSGCLSEAGIAPTRVRKSILTVRTNPIRVQSPDGGTSGPMSRELSWEDVSERAGVGADVLRQREKTTTTKRLRRVAEFDWKLLQKAVSLNGATDIALTFVDYISKDNHGVIRYDQLTDDTRDFVNAIEATTSVPVSLISTGFNERSVIDRRFKW